MAGLLIRELQLRGLAERILIVAPSNLAFQWQRELHDKWPQAMPPSGAGVWTPGTPRTTR